MSRSSRSRAPSWFSDMVGRAGFSPFLLANLAVLILAIGAGGASRQNLPMATVVEIAAFALLPWAMLRLSQQADWRTLAWPLTIIGVIVLIPVLQIIPLPVDIWLNLPAGSRIYEIYNAAEIEAAARPLSITPGLTARSGLAVLVPIIVFLSWSSLSVAERRIGIIVILTMVLASLILGAAQLAGRGANLAYIYDNTNVGFPVGFFSNRNHQASLLLCALPLGAALFGSLDRQRTRRIVTVSLCLGLGLVVLVGLAALRSRVGLGLVGPALFASFLMLILSGRLGRSSRAAIILGGLIIAVLFLVGWFGIGPILERFQTNLSDESRFAVLPTIWNGAVEFFPFGSGLGSFDSIYRSIERLDLVQAAFLNHAHNDYLEALLETGVLGVIALALFTVWWLVKGIPSWTAERSSNRIMTQAGFVAVGLLMAHSGFDYPLRTLALASLFGFSCALMIPPAGSGGAARPDLNASLQAQLRPERVRTRKRVRA